MEVREKTLAKKTCFSTYLYKPFNKYILQLLVKGHNIAYTGIGIIAFRLLIHKTELFNKVYDYNGEVDVCLGGNGDHDVIFFEKYEDIERFDNEYLTPMLLAAEIRRRNK
jgi:hypothetical protein